MKFKVGDKVILVNALDLYEGEKLLSVKFTIKSILQTDHAYLNPLIEVQERAGQYYSWRFKLDVLSYIKDVKNRQ